MAESSNKDGILIPEGGTPDALRVGVEVELAKFLLALLNPGLGAVAKATHDISKAFKSYNQAQKDAKARDFLASIATMVTKHEVKLKQLLEKPEPAESEDSFAAVFLRNLEAAYNDDERAKARYYAAFAAGWFDKALAIPQANKLILFDLLKQLRAHDLFLLLELVNRAKAFDSMGNPSPLKGPTVYQNDILQLQGTMLGAISNPSLILHGLASLESSDLIQRRGRDVRAVVVGQSDPGVSIEVTPIGLQLMGLLIPNLTSNVQS